MLSVRYVRVDVGRRTGMEGKYMLFANLYVKNDKTGGEEKAEATK